MVQAWEGPSGGTGLGAARGWVEMSPRGTLLPGCPPPPGTQEHCWLAGCGKETPFPAESSPPGFSRPRLLQASPLPNSPRQHPPPRRPPPEASSPTLCGAAEVADDVPATLLPRGLSSHPNPDRGPRPGRSGDGPMLQGCTLGSQVGLCEAGFSLEQPGDGTDLCLRNSGPRGSGVCGCQPLPVGPACPSPCRAPLVPGTTNPFCCPVFTRAVRMLAWP